MVGSDAVSWCRQHGYTKLIPHFNSQINNLFYLVQIPTTELNKYLDEDEIIRFKKDLLLLTHQSQGTKDDDLANNLIYEETNQPFPINSSYPIFPTGYELENNPLGKEPLPYFEDNNNFNDIEDFPFAVENDLFDNVNPSFEQLVVGTSFDDEPINSLHSELTASFPASAPVGDFYDDYEFFPQSNSNINTVLNSLNNVNHPKSLSSLQSMRISDITFPVQQDILNVVKDSSQSSNSTKSLLSTTSISSIASSQMSVLPKLTGVIKHFIHLSELLVGFIVTDEDDSVFIFKLENFKVDVEVTNQGYVSKLGPRSLMKKKRYNKGSQDCRYLIGSRVTFHASYDIDIGPEAVDIELSELPPQTSDLFQAGELYTGFVYNVVNNNFGFLKLSCGMEVWFSANIQSSSHQSFRRGDVVSFTAHWSNVGKAQAHKPRVVQSLQGNLVKGTIIAHFKNPTGRMYSFILLDKEFANDLETFPVVSIEVSRNSICKIGSIVKGTLDSRVNGFWWATNVELESTPSKSEEIFVVSLSDYFN
eukprot:TRINITY_DN2914_c2_g5_i1.p1 TRINITY_DN2914_c2_g5~~TRINITY_DN2914_c2_g5_i1.p1  ORF type:complete len:533 (+),score=143.27 TRINITY_DN2914_c2_g5_i1:71-1669(+)